jgi:hypothetical protein
MGGRQVSDPTSCKICKEAAKTLDGTLKCDGPCQAWFHGNCIQLKPAQIKRIVNTQRENPWLCSACYEERPINKTAGETTPTSSSNSHFSTESGILQILNEIKQMNIKIDKIDKIEESQNFISDQFEDIKKEIKMIHEVKHDVNKLKQDNTALKEQVSSLQSQITLLENNITSKQLIIENIPSKSNENLKNIFYKLATKLGVPDTATNISEIRRLGKQTSEDKKPPPILIQFQSPDIRNTILTKRREAVMVYSNECDPDNNNFGQKEIKTIYVNPNYPKAIRTLFYEARALKKDTTIKFIFVKGLKVFGKLSIQEQPFEIKDQTHIKVLLEQYKKT